MSIIPVSRTMLDGLTGESINTLRMKRIPLLLASPFLYWPAKTIFNGDSNSDSTKEVGKNDFHDLKWFRQPCLK